MKLIPVDHRNPTHAQALYELLAERDPAHFISHEKMPTMEEHLRFMQSLPFLWWCLIEVPVTNLANIFVGAIECTDRNEIGVSIFKRHQREGRGSKALRMFMDTHKPLPAIPAIRNGNWLANIACANRDSKRFFMTMGFQPIQETWRRA